MLIKVYNPLTGKYEEKTLERISTNMYIGLLHNYMDKANSVLKKYNEVLEKTHRHLLKRKVSWVHEEFDKSPKQKLVKASSFRLNKALKEMDNLSMDFRNDYYIDVDIDNVKEVISEMIGKAKLGLLHIPRLKVITDSRVYRSKRYGYYLLKYFIPVPERKEVIGGKRYRAPNRAQELLVEFEKKSAKRRTVIAKPRKEEEEEVYKGRLFKVPAFLSLPLLINKKRLENV